MNCIEIVVWKCNQYDYVNVLSGQELTLSQMTNLDSSKLKVFADDNLKFNDNGRKFSDMVENTVTKGEIGHYVQFLLFPQCFQKTWTADTWKTRARVKKLFRRTYY